MNDELAEIIGAYVELDQKLSAAFRQAGADDAGVFGAILRTNPSLLRHVPDDSEFLSKVSDWLDSQPHGSPLDIERVFTRLRETRPGTNTITTSAFLSALLEIGHETGHDYEDRPFTVDLLTSVLDGDISAPISSAPRTNAFLSHLKTNIARPDDFQFIMSSHGGRLSFRVVSVLDDYVQRSDSGILVPERALLTHFKETFGGFTQDEIEELEELLNDSKAIEADFQRFFEGHSHFLRRWDHREVCPQVVLTRPEGDLIPDFILTDRDLQRAAILDLKLPRPKLIRRQKNRDRFASAVMESRVQLLRYRDWFRQDRNRESLKQRLGMAIYEPELIVIIGRATEFQDELDRQQLTADNPDLTIVTYDDILAFANRRRIIIEP